MRLLFTRMFGLIVIFSRPPLLTAAETRVEVVAGAEAARASDGRLLLFAQKVDPATEKPVKQVDVNQFFYQKNFVASREVVGLTEGRRLRFDGDDLSYPVPLDQLPPGEYWMQALLDRNHSYVYSGRGEGDVVSEVVRVRLPQEGPAPTLTLQKTLPPLGLWEYPFGPMLRPGEETTVQARVELFHFNSRSLSAFAGRPVSLQGLILTPDGYEKSTHRYPVVYFTQGFTGGMTFLADQAVNVMRQMREGRMPPMIWVFLDESGPTGTHEFADSVNNGPWGRALTHELIPDIERRYRTDNAPSGRFITGHSSGGWAALWIQVNYPKLFGGAWATAPDFSDFTDFWGVDITRPGARMKSLTRGRIEAVLGEYGGQESSFEWVFSPRGADGRPMPLYHRMTGVVDPQVAAYWRANWDISQIIRNRWTELGPDLDGKIRVIAGDKDEAGLDKAARHLEAAFQAVGGRATFTYIPGKGHFNLYAEGNERMALRRKIAWQMWKAARPSSPLTDPGPRPPSPESTPSTSKGQETKTRPQP